MTQHHNTIVRGQLSSGRNVRIGATVPPVAGAIQVPGAGHLLAAHTTSQTQGVQASGKHILFTEPVRTENGEIPLGYVGTYKGFYTCLYESDSNGGYHASASSFPFAVAGEVCHGENARSRALESVFVAIVRQWEYMEAIAADPAHAETPEAAAARRKIAMFAPYLPGSEAQSKEEGDAFIIRQNQQAKLAKAVMSASRGNSAEFVRFVEAEQESRNATARDTYHTYRLWRGRLDVDPSGVANPANDYYTRTRAGFPVDSRNDSPECNLDGAVRYDCPDQEFVDQVNDAARRLKLTIRLTTKHEMILQLLLAAIWRGEIDWQPFADGIGFETNCAPQGAVVESDQEQAAPLEFIASRFEFVRRECACLDVIKAEAYHQERTASADYMAHKQMQASTPCAPDVLAGLNARTGIALVNWQTVRDAARNAHIVLGRLGAMMDEFEAGADQGAGILEMPRSKGHSACVRVQHKGDFDE